jgi:formate hydrogenlyase subunit 3/multisubunit Na+/H+ antiporter MnhD subunit
MKKIVGILLVIIAIFVIMLAVMYIKTENDMKNLSYYEVKE